MALGEGRVGEDLEGGAVQNGGLVKSAAGEDGGTGVDGAEGVLDDCFDIFLSGGGGMVLDPAISSVLGLGLDCEVLGGVGR